MDELKRMEHLFRQAMDGQPWHGPSLAIVLQGVDARTAAARPIDGAHSIWEITLHLTGWTREVSNRLRGRSPGIPPEGDWPKSESIDENRWKAVRADLFEAHQELIAELLRLPPSRLDENVGAERDAPLGSGVSYREMVLGALQHDAYHSGQMAVLQKRRG
jgi:uncharacterized damage-inducible protein DinB